MNLLLNGTPGGTRTPDLLLRRQLLYPAELLAHKSMERVTGIGPAYPAWKAGVLPLNYTRTALLSRIQLVNSSIHFFRCQAGIRIFFALPREQKKVHARKPK